MPAFELGPVRGARVTVRGGWSGDAGLMRVACASAPAGGFAPGVEELVFGRATQIARGALPGVKRLDAGPVRATRWGFDQALDGAADVDGQASIRARNLLGFAEHGATAFVCTVACVARRAGACASAVEDTRLEGGLAAPPPPSMTTRAIFFGAEHPMEAAGVLALGFVVVATWVVVRRPRQRIRLG